MDNKIQFLAYYLPQFHPIPENDEWWGKGFTEWTNVTKAKPLFKNHFQPILPSDLGFYDLRVPETQEAQSKLALDYGIDGFVYYQYWFGDDKFLLEKPAEQMLKNPKVAIPFCFCWANETWKGIWHGLDNPDVLIEQKYLGEEDYTKYFNYLLPFFKDKRYIKIDNMPVFHIYRIQEIPDWQLFFNVFNNLSKLNGFDGILFVNSTQSNNEEIINHDSLFGEVGVDVFNKMRYKSAFLFQNIRYIGWFERKLKASLGISNQIGKRNKPLIYDYSKAVKKLNIDFPNSKYLQCVFPNWDNSARSGKKSLIFKNSNPNAWKEHLKMACLKLKENKKNPNIIIIKSWNEWAEGNHLEPDRKFGHQWLEVIKQVKNEFNEK